MRIGGGWAADRGGHPKWVAFLGYGLSARRPVLPALQHRARRHLGRDLGRPDRQGHPHRAARRDDLRRHARGEPRLRLRRAPGAGHHRSRDRAADRVRRAVVDPRRLPHGHGHLVRRSRSSASPCSACWCRTGRPRRHAPVRAPAGALACRRRHPAWCACSSSPARSGCSPSATASSTSRCSTAAASRRTGSRCSTSGPTSPTSSLAIPIGRLADRVGKAQVLIGGHVALLAAYATVAISWNIAASTVLALLLLGTFYAATDGVIAALAGRLVPPSVRASGIAVGPDRRGARPDGFLGGLRGAVVPGRSAARADPGRRGSAARAPGRPGRRTTPRRCRSVRRHEPAHPHRPLRGAGRSWSSPAPTAYVVASAASYQPHPRPPAHRARPSPTTRR